MRFFCSLCNLEITKFSKKEKETHWLSTHFSSELSRFTTGLVCSFCLHKADTRADLLIHVGVKHDKVYNFLPVLPFQTKQSLQGHFNNNPTPIKSNIRLESQSISAGNILLGPSLLVKCKFNTSQPSTAQSYYSQHRRKGWPFQVSHPHIPNSHAGLVLHLLQQLAYTYLSSNSLLLLSWPGRKLSLLSSQTGPACQF